MISKLMRRASLATASLFAVSSVAVGVAPAIGAEPPGGSGDHAVLQVSKTASTSFTRTYNWTISKSAEPSQIIVRKGGKATVNYTVKVGLAMPPTTDSKFMVSGDISIANPSEHRRALITSVTDKVKENVSGVSTAATVNCGVKFPYLLAPRATLKCSYSASLPSKNLATNTATVTSSRHGQTVVSTASAPVDFSKATITVLDKSVLVKDRLGHVRAIVSADQVAAGPKSFAYSRTFGPFFKPGVFKIENVALLITKDTHTKKLAEAKVLVIVKRHHHHNHD